MWSSNTWQSLTASKAFCSRRQRGWSQAASAVQGMYALFAVKREPEAFYYPSLPSSWSDISSAHPGSTRAQGLKRAPAIDPDQKPDWAHIQMFDTRPSKQERETKEEDVLTALTPPLLFSSPSVPGKSHHLSPIWPSNTGAQSRRQKPVTYCLGFRVSLQMVTWSKHPPCRSHLLLLTVEADTPSLVSPKFFLSCFSVNTSPIFPLAPTTHISSLDSSGQPTHQPTVRDAFVKPHAFRPHSYSSNKLCWYQQAFPTTQLPSSPPIHEVLPGHQYFTDWLIGVKPNLHTRRASLQSQLSCACFMQPSSSCSHYSSLAKIQQTPLKYTQIFFHIPRSHRRPHAWCSCSACKLLSLASQPMPSFGYVLWPPSSTLGNNGYSFSCTLNQSSLLFC